MRTKISTCDLIKAISESGVKEWDVVYSVCRATSNIERGHYREIIPGPAWVSLEVKGLVEKKPDELHEATNA